MNHDEFPPRRSTQSIAVLICRAAAALAVTAVLAACQSSPPTRMSQDTTNSLTAPLSPTPSPTNVTTPRLTPDDDGRCLTANLRVGVGPGSNDMQGAHVPLRFTNTGSATCTLLGAPGVSYVTAENGEQVGEPATRNTDGPEVALAPGETASAGLFLSSAPLKTPACERVEVPGIRVYPPGNTEAMFVEQSATACEPPLVGPFLKVGPVEPGADNTAS